MFTPINEYAKIQRTDESDFYVVHFDGVMFYAGEDENGHSVWSDSLQDSAILHSRESAELIKNEFTGSDYGPVTIDLDETV